MLLVIALSGLSWKYVENPFRNRKRFGRKSIFAGTAVLAIGLLGITFVASRPSVSSNRPTLTGLTFSEIENRLSRNFGLSEDCFEFEPESPECRSANDPTVVVWGDSYARQLGQALKHSKTQKSFIQMSKSACAPILGLAIQDSKLNLESGKDCMKFNDNVFDWISNNPQIEYVIIASPWSLMDQTAVTIDRKFERFTDESRKLEALKATITKIENLGVKVVGLYGTPANPESGGQCIRATLTRGGDLSECDYPVSSNVRRPLYESMKTVESLAPFWSWEPVICPEPENVCRMSRDDLLIYVDTGHITVEAAVMFGEKYDIMGQLIKAAEYGNSAN
jgi:hypothetical protein